ncbi:MAG: diguanylate cyclase [Desulfamplus sp.]|nr:diguanylate cyclase [Desulfamplus sp.]
MKQIYKFLIFEDNDIDFYVISELIYGIKKYKTEISRTKTLAEGLEILTKEKFDLLILDLNLLDSWGIQTFTSVYENSPQLPIVILSAIHDDEIASKAVKTGAQDYISKSNLTIELLSKTCEYAIKRKSIELKFRDREHRLKTIFNSVLSGIIIVDIENRVIVEINSEALNIIGSEREAIVGSCCRDYFLNCNNECLPITRDAGCIFEVLIKKSDGTCITVLKTVTDIVLNGRPHLLESFIDISERKKLEDAFRRQAMHDPLTGLYNRRHLNDMIETSIKSAVRHNTPLSLCLCDLDAFKIVNDTYGHQTGDHVLIAFACIMKEQLRSEDIAGRYGGDEFCMIFTHSHAEKSLLALERIRSIFEKTVFESMDKSLFSISSTFGIADFSKGMSAIQLVSHADKALYRAKRLGRNRIEKY